MTIQYDSRQIASKRPFGAVPEGETVFFQATGPLSLKRLALVYYRDYSPWTRVQMERRQEGEKAVFSCQAAFSEAQIYWYFFQGEGEQGPVSFYRDVSSNRPMEAVEGATWQQTVYRRNLPSPDLPSPLDRYLGQIMYQIFPDRFCASGVPKKNVPEDRIIQPDPQAQPLFRLEEGQNRDYYGGDLEGIRGQLSYLSSLSVGMVYLNPIFEAHSNHRYNTADYHKIDPLLGEEQDLALLAAQAKERGIGLILDGVFSHTGSDSLYFNKEGRYDSLGAYQSQNSPYSSWYRFRRFPDDYACWWNVPTLPEVTEEDPSFLSFICGPLPEKEQGSDNNPVSHKPAPFQSVLAHWQALGLAGWRLDVADELPDRFLDRFAASLKALNPGALLIGEVWEDASNKISYGQRRRYLLGGQLDSVMNYPFREAVLRYVREGDVRFFVETVESICENYPPQALHLLMNPLSTHDTPRAITLLAGDSSQDRDREWQSCHALSPEQFQLGKKRLLLAMALQYTLPGFPSVYYGDEQLMQGYGDPFNRGFFTHAQGDPDFLEAVKALGRVRTTQNCYRKGVFSFLFGDTNVLAFSRGQGRERRATAINRSARPVTLPLSCPPDGLLFSRGAALTEEGLLLTPYSCAILVLPPEKRGSNQGGDDQRFQ